MKSLLIPLLLLSGLAGQAQQKGTADTVQAKPPIAYAHICNGPASKKYHKTADCRGLRHCSTSIEKLTKAQAATKGRTPCAICYPKKSQATTYEYRSPSPTKQPKIYSRPVKQPEANGRPVSNRKQMADTMRK